MHAHESYRIGLIAAAIALCTMSANANEIEEKSDTQIDAMAIPVHERAPASGTWIIPRILTTGSCNGSGTNVVVQQSSKPINIVMCRISRYPGGEKREFINRTIPGGNGFFTVGCSKDGPTIYGYEVHWWDPDTSYFPNPIADGSAALTWSANVLENGNQFKSVMVEVARPNGQMYPIKIDAKQAEPVPRSWSIMKAWYTWPYETTRCDDGRG